MSLRAAYSEMISVSAVPLHRSPGHSSARLRSSPVSPLPAASFALPTGGPSSSSVPPASSVSLALLLSSPALSALLLSFLSSSAARELRCVCRPSAAAAASVCCIEEAASGSAAPQRAGLGSTGSTTRRLRDAQRAATQTGAAAMRRRSSTAGDDEAAASSSPLHASPPLAPLSPVLPSFSLPASAVSMRSSRVAPSSPPSPASSTRSSTPSSERSVSSGVSSVHPLLRDDADVFSASGWHKSSASCLLRATEAVDVCCHAIVSTNNTFHNSSSVSVESRRLALTVAVFERSLYAYALRISAAARHATQQQQHSQQQQQQLGQYNGPHSTASSATSTPTLSASEQSTAAVSHSHRLSAPSPLPPLPSAPFMPQLPSYTAQPLHTHTEGDEWQPQSAHSQAALSYTSTIPSSSAHSLAASAIASTQRMQQHTQQQHSRFVQQSNGSTAGSIASHRLPRPPVSGPQPSLPPTPSSAAASAYAALPGSPIPPTVSAPPGAWTGHRSSSGAMLYTPAVAIPPTTPSGSAATAVPTHSQLLAGLDSASLPAASFAQSFQPSASRATRSRTFSASPVYASPALSQPSAMLHAASAASPLSGPLAHYNALLSAVPASPTPRSSSPVDSSAALPSSPFSHSYSPLVTHRSLLTHSQGGGAQSSAASTAATFGSGSAASEQMQQPGLWHQPAGMTCLLRILTHQLLETRTVLLALNADCSSFPRYVRHLLNQSVHVPAVAVKSAARHPRRVMLAASAAAFVSLLHNTQPLTALRATLARGGQHSQLHLRGQLDAAAHSSAAAFLLSFIPPSIQSAVLTVACVLSPRVLLPQLRAALHTRAAFTIIPLCLWLVYRLSRYRRIAHLKTLHSRLGLLLRLWHISFSLLEAGGRTAHSQAGSGSGGGAGSGRERRLSESLTDSSALLANRERARVPISRWLLELVPPELDASFWYHSTFRLSLVKYGLDVLYCSVNEWYRACACRPVGLPLLVLAIAYYACQPHLAAQTTSRLMAAPDIAMVRHAWRLLDTTLARRVVTQLLPALGRSARLAVLRDIELVDADTLQRLSHERSHARKQSSGRTAKDSESRYEVRLSPSARASGKPLRLSDSCIRLSPRKQPRRYQRVGSSGLHESRSSQLDDSDDTQLGSDSTLRLLLLSARPLDLHVNLRFHRVPSVSHFQPARPTSSAVVLYLHGGGFFADFQASHLHFLSEWSSELGLPVLYVNYSLAPDNSYPTALNECYDAYRWLLEGRLGLNAERVILVGDSTGGNLAAGCVMKAIQDKLRVPDAVILACPILNLRLTPTPSRSLYMMDAVLPMNLLLACRSLYLASPAAASDADIDVCLSAVIASDALLRQWPLTSIMVGAYDPFVDDAVDFAHRLAAVGVPVRLKVYEQLPHSFFDFAPLLPQARQALQLAGEWIRQSAEQPQPHTSPCSQHSSDDDA